MIKIRAKNQVLTSFVYIILIGLSSCQNYSNKSGQNLTNQYGESWKKGKDIFYENCAQCHIPRNKDEIFEDYISNQFTLSKSLRVDRLKSVFLDSNHLNKNIQTDSFSEDQISQILKFIETPQKRTVIN